MKLNKKRNVIHDLLDKQRGQCYYCREEMVWIIQNSDPRCQIACEEMLTVDHKFPVCKGGRDTKRNMVLACRRCNRKKGDKKLSRNGVKRLLEIK